MIEEILLEKVKANLILIHAEDDEMLLGFIRAAVSYAEGYQHKPGGFYTRIKRGKPINPMIPATEQAVIILASHFYESRDGSTAGFFADNAPAAQGVWLAVHRLLNVDKDWSV